LVGEVELVWLEDVRAKLGLADKLYGAIALRFAGALHRRLGVSASDPAAVLFTSGSEGVPKGVALSHANLLANRRQIAARVDFSPADLALNALPMFHSFGLTGGFLLPLLSGVRVFLYPSPLHYRIVPEIAYATGATILFGTDTFLAGYARRANPYDFYALRYVFAGAEPVREETRKLWSERFGKRILEGYGVTECSPVIAVNTPMHYRAGTVGRFLPLVEHRLEPVPGIERGGRLVVRGPNVMAGYLRGGDIEGPEGGWYDTGDIVAVDADGFATIVGRIKRFAKLGGEMVSLAAAERIAETAVPETRHAVVALPDPRRGEKLILVTEAKGFDRSRLIEAAHRLGLPEIAVPRDVIEIERLPLLGTGKTDYGVVLRLAEQSMTALPEEGAPAEPATLSLVRG
jgi:acyl-[acyl-carrier-protein]-phospholipid O-acyltransferase/long-chain-fatty-acid--[acyl-carrier-protein] ligase